MSRGRGGAGTLRIIAVFKFFEALLLVAAGCGALGLLDASWQHALVGWLDELSLHEGRRLTSEFASKALDTLSSANLQRLVLIAIGCFVYAGVFLAEATGLWLQKRWGEYLTTIITASLLPFEVIELIHRVSAVRIVVLIVNLLVLGHLIWRLVTERPNGAAIKD